MTAAERAAEEILPGSADMPETQRHYMLSLSRPDGSRAEPCRRSPALDARRDSQQRVYVGGVRLGSVPDSAEFQTGLDSYIRNTMPTWAVNGYLSRGVEFRTQYSRTGSETNEDDMILLVTAWLPSCIPTAAAMSPWRNLAWSKNQRFFDKKDCGSVLCLASSALTTREVFFAVRGEKLCEAF